ncbi:hypothetical protein C8Q77DRAFT_1160239 [Trametes polyzona]|nr:hypothetical protein C8Q77DRAFT_1160239 [Trametes polyzona]
MIISPTSTQYRTGEAAALHVLVDSGRPKHSSAYTTLVLVHGLGWHAGNFQNILPFAKQFNARIVLVNRRDYPGSLACTPEEHAQLSRLAQSATTADVSEDTSAVMAGHAYDIYDFLVDFVRRERIPIAGHDDGAGGIVLVGWSLACVWITAFLANVGLFPAQEDVPLAQYLRRVILYEPSCVLLGYPRPMDLYHPLADASISPEHLPAVYNRWLAGYYAHGDVPAHGSVALESVTPVEGIPDTISGLTEDELSGSLYTPPMEPSGNDRLLIEACLSHGTWADLKDAAFYPSQALPVVGVHSENPVADWSCVGVRVAWCDRSMWEMPWGAHLLEKELAEARAAGETVRDVEFVRLKGANHFAHWDMPEKAMRAFLGDDTAV